ncbi:MAG: L,D-transpeptidase [Actinomycetota bacterium]
MPSLAIEFDWVDPLNLGESVVVRAADDVLIAYDAPDGDASSVVELANPTPRGGPLVLAAVDPEAAERAEWVEVHLPVRPNGSTGWVRAADVDLFRNPYSVEVSTSEFEMTVFKNDEPIVVAEIAVGREVAPTPHGAFFLAELLQPESPDGTYGPFAFGLSGFSDVYTEFAGGDGVIGIHGTNAPDLLGTAASHGCVRVDNETIEALASLLPLGTPVTVSA